MSKELTDALAQFITVKDGKLAVRPQAQPGKKISASKKSGAKKPSLFTRLANVYAGMENAYNASATAAGLTCAGCATNCCTSFFQHHTHVEWAYLWRGLSALPQARQKEIVRRAEAYVEEARSATALGAVPTAMCPLNEEGLCILYSHRLMICRMHGTRNVMRLPDGDVRYFPGCARFTAMHGPGGEGCEALDRTPYYQELAALEAEFRQRAGKQLPKVDMTLAQMILSGPPKIR